MPSKNKPSSQLNGHDLETVRAALLEKRAELVRKRDSQMSHLNSGDKHHLADLEEMASDSSDADSYCALVDLSTSTLEQVDVALEKVEKGTYGECERCHEAIAPARLEFLPFAALCIDCQRELEKNPVPEN